MKKSLLSFLVVLQFLTVVTSALAADFHVCPCDSGAQAGCTPGNDGTLTPTNPSTPRNWFTAAFYNARSPGDRILICQGGAKVNGSISGMLNNTTTSPITIGTYVASWGGAGVKPWIRLTPDSSGWQFGGGVDGRDNTGPVVEGIKIDGGGSANNVIRCIETYDSSWHGFTVQDSEIVGCEIGIYPGDVDQNFTGNRGMKFLRNYFHGNYGAGGIFGAMYDFLIEGNTFKWNGATGGVDHQLYLGGWGGKGVIRHNDFSAAGSVDGSGSDECVGGNITIHGRYDGLQINGNRFVSGSYSAQCAAIKVNPGYSEVGHLPEFFRNVAIWGNTIRNAIVGIGVAAAPGVVIESNEIVDVDTGINLPDSTRSENDDLDNAAKIQNNTIDFRSPSTNKTGIRVSAASQSPGTNIIMRNNIIRFDVGSVTKWCFEHPALSSFADFSKNYCFNSGGGFMSFSPTYSTMAAAQSAGFNTGGSSSDPLITVPTTGNNLSVKPLAGSPVIGAGSNCPRVSLKGRPITSCSIGAHQSVDP